MTQASRPNNAHGTAADRLRSLRRADGGQNPFGYGETRNLLTQPKLCQELKTPRIDRLLIPKLSLIRLGWDHGAIGIECKKSGDKIGRPIAQMLDYNRATWHVRNHPGVWFMLQGVFLWPLEKTSGPLASILSQHRVGSAESTPYSTLRLCTGEHTVLDVRIDGTVRIGDWTSGGRKTGSR